MISYHFVIPSEALFQYKTGASVPDMPMGVKGGVNGLVALWLTFLN
jgi:hypothetical protein